LLKIIRKSKDAGDIKAQESRRMLIDADPKIMRLIQQKEDRWYWRWIEKEKRELIIEAMEQSAEINKPFGYPKKLGRKLGDFFGLKRVVDKPKVFNSRIVSKINRHNGAISLTEMVYPRGLKSLFMKIPSISPTSKDYGYFEKKVKNNFITNILNSRNRKKIKFNLIHKYRHLKSSEIYFHLYKKYPYIAIISRHIRTKTDEELYNSILNKIELGKENIGTLKEEIKTFAREDKEILNLFNKILSDTIFRQKFMQDAKQATIELNNYDELNEAFAYFKSYYEGRISKYRFIFPKTQRDYYFQILQKFNNKLMKNNFTKQQAAQIVLNFDTTNIERIEELLKDENQFDEFIIFAKNEPDKREVASKYFALEFLENADLQLKIITREVEEAEKILYEIELESKT